MLHVLLLILKILLLILLGILGLVLVILLLVLFAPIRYKIDAHIHDNITVKAKVNFLIVSVSVLFDKNKKAFGNQIRILGIPFGGKKKEKPNKKSNKKKTENKPTKDAGEKVNVADSFTEEDYLDIAEDYKVKTNKNQKLDLKDSDLEQASFNDTDNAEEAKETEDTNNIDNTSDAVDTDNAEDTNIEEFDLLDEDRDKLEEDIGKEEMKFFGRLKAFFVKLFEKLKAIYEKLQNYTPDKIEERINKKTAKIKKKIAKIKKFWNLSCTVKTRAYLKKYIVSLFKHIGPRKAKGYIHYGFKEPYQTGLYTGYLSMLPFMYQKKLTLEPDFYNKVLEGDITLKGHLRLGYILRIALNINIWRTLKVAKKVLK